jgi:O-antigen ligase
LLLAILVIASPFIAPPRHLIQRFGELSNPETAGMDRRIIWKQTIDLIKDYPMFGCGLGGYAFTYLKYKTDMPLWGTSFVHNDYLQGMAELGLIGVLIFLGFIMRLLMLLLRMFLTCSDFELRMLALACGASLSALLAHGLVDFNFYIPANAMGFAWICGVTAALPVLRKETALRIRPDAHVPQDTRSYGGQHKCDTLF